MWTIVQGNCFDSIGLYQAILPNPCLPCKSSDFRFHHTPIIVVSVSNPQQPPLSLKGKSDQNCKAKVRGLTVNAQFRMSNNLLNQTLVLKISEGLARQTAVDFESIDEDRDCDEAV